MAKPEKQEKCLLDTLPSPMPGFANLITQHPQSQYLCGNKKPEDMTLREQLKILSPYYGGCVRAQEALGEKDKTIGAGLSQYLKLPKRIFAKIKHLTAILEWWRELHKSKNYSLSLAHPLPELGKLIAEHPQYESFCNGTKPEKLPLRRQLQILSEQRGGYRLVEIGIGSTHTNIGKKLKGWLSESSTMYANTGDVMAVVDYWKEQQAFKDASFSLQAPCPRLAECFGLPKDSILYDNLLKMAGMLESGEIGILPWAAELSWVKMILGDAIPPPQTELPPDPLGKKPKSPGPVAVGASHPRSLVPSGGGEHQP